MPEIGKFFLLIGGLFVIIGLIMYLAPHIPFLGKLPGDIHYKGKNVQFYFPIVTCIIISLILTLLFNLFGGGK